MDETTPLDTLTLSANNTDTSAPATQPQQTRQNTSASSAAAADRPNLTGRRRMLTRLQRGLGALPSSSRTPNPNFNPEAAEFVPVGRMPPKRKASSSARSGAKLSSPRRNPSTSDYPVIRAEHLFGRDAQRPESEVFEIERLLVEDDEQSEIFDLEMQDPRPQNQPQGTGIHRERLREAWGMIRSQAEKTKFIAPDAIQYHSAILFSQENATQRGSPISPLLELDSLEINGNFRDMRYLPLYPTPASSSRPDAITKDTELTVLPSHRERIDKHDKAVLASKARWPTAGRVPNPLPLEIFDIITEFLSRDDIKSMRLVNKEFESKVSATLFSSSVVPFNTELYDMIDEYRPLQATRVTRKGKGKARAKDASPPAAAGLHWQNAMEDAEGKMYRGHGLRVFQGFGPHIKRFGMSFEVAEGQLARPPIKKELDHVDSYHGSYDWPHQQYTRFANLAGLERTADETLRMKAAFSNLQKVQDLALSLDNGLGWLNGPDKSIYARVFQQPSAVFGQSRPVPDQQMQQAKAFWAAIQSCHRSLGIMGNPKEISLARRMIAKSPAELSGLQGTRYADTKKWLSIPTERAATAISVNGTIDDSRFGVMYTTFNQPDTSNCNLYDKSALVPAELRKEQKEWLMETDWAQRAFLECYMLAITDNPATFGKVKTLTIAKISSGLLPILARESFWDALPSLTDVTIHVKPDWRTVEKDNAGFAEACSRNPSDAVNVFHKNILRDCICLRPSITKLNVGWVGGGEHAEGIFARNNHLLPAPITALEHSTAVNANFGLVFKFVEHLTLTNCWITPPTLQELVNVHATKSLKTLVLDSVSLTAHPRFQPGGQAALAQQIQQQLGQAAGAMHQQLAQAFLPMLQAANGGGVAVPQGFLANMQQWLLNNQGAPVGAVQFQQMLQHHAQQLGGLNQQAAAAVPPAQPAQAAQQAPPGQPAQAPPIQQVSNPAPSHWTDGHREGSWPEVIDRISPGPVFSDFLPQPAPWEEPLPDRAQTNLRSIEFKSCGYVKLLNNSTFDQFAIEAGWDQHLTVWFRSRQAALTSAMMNTGDRHLGKIIQRIPHTEWNALLLAWGLTEGPWAEGAEEPEYDGLLPGGTGRFSGRIDAGAPATISSES